jgi:hypothetical protein
VTRAISGGIYPRADALDAGVGSLGNAIGSALNGADRATRAIEGDATPVDSARAALSSALGR